MRAKRGRIAWRGSARQWRGCASTRGGEKSVAWRGVVRELKRGVARGGEVGEWRWRGVRGDEE
eukprot:12907683-Prorocentrum_lima.AAC.1